MKNSLIPTTCVAVLIVTACNRKVVIVETPAPTPAPLPVARTETFETQTLGKAVDSFEQTPSTVQAAKVDKAFAEIDGEIAELVEHVAKKTGDDRAEAARKLKDLRTYRDAENARYFRFKAKAAVGLPPTENPPANGGAEKLGEKIDDAAHKVEDRLKDAADAIRDKAR